MAASICEQILARVADALLDAGLAGGRVYRNRNDPLGADECPAIKITRGETEAESFGNGSDRVRFDFSVDHIVTGADVETAADALAVATQLVLLADEQLAALGRGLRCRATDPTPDEADMDAYRLTARYEIHFLTRPGDPTRNLS